MRSHIDWRGGCNVPVRMLAPRLEGGCNVRCWPLRGGGLCDTVSIGGWIMRFHIGKNETFPIVWKSLPCVLKL